MAEVRANETWNSPDLERTFVHEVYDKIASHFDKTRVCQWKGVKEFLSSLPIGSLLFDVGCGNGKYLNQDSLIKLGCDRSVELCKVSVKKGCHVVLADCQNLPLPDNKFDAVISIAVIHHLASEERRLRAVQEILRILKPGRTALIYVWAYEQTWKSTILKQGLTRLV